MSDHAPAILAGLEPMFKEAEAKGLWFYCSYQGMWFSPVELRAEHANGKFIWSDVNWRLRSPEEGLRELEDEAARAQVAVVKFSDRMQKR